MDRAACAPDPRAALSVAELEQLTYWKWRYRLQAGDFGERFSTAESRRLVFMAWRREKQNAYADDRAPAAEESDG
jgi:hypothetical protein